MSMESIMADIAEERLRQDREWGFNRHYPLGLWHLVLSEEVGEVARCCQERKAGSERTPLELRAELVQVAAVCVAWIEDLDRRRGRGPTREEVVEAMGEEQSC